MCAALPLGVVGLAALAVVEFLRSMQVSISPNSFVVGVLSQVTRPEEVSMHPKMMIALANELQRSRGSERQRVELRSLALAHGGHGSERSHAASGFARRLLAGINLRPGLF